jgi:hypothetical protein
VFQDWIITDACDDGLDIEWRLFALDRDWAWPDATTVPHHRPRLVDSYATIQCFAGETICTAQRRGLAPCGASNLDGSGSCDDCCFACGERTSTTSTRVTWNARAGPVRGPLQSRAFAATSLLPHWPCGDRARVAP